MKFSVLGTGEELLLGLTENTNFGEIARTLREHGHEVIHGAIVGDDLDALRNAVLDASSRAEAVIMTGGIGPTRDDLTRDALGAAAGVPVVLREEEVRVLEERFRGLGREMPRASRVQARFPEGADVIPNPVGLAAGFEIRIGEARVFALSGVPREMRSMLEDGVIPRVAAESGRARAVVVRRLRIFGTVESELDPLLGDLMARGADPLLGMTVVGGVLTVTVSSRGAPEVARTAVARVEARIRELVGDRIFGCDDDTLEGVAAAELMRTGFTVAVAESCTGGLVAARLVGVPGISSHFLEAAVTYSNEAKIRRLGVSVETLDAHGAVSAQTAAEMAEGIRRTAGADVGLSTTGIAGPDGGTEDKPVGLVYTGLSIQGRISADRRRHIGGRRSIRDRAAKTALDLLRRALSGEAR
jgi:competence/damage-inducible protein CinA-like protein